jgi:S1-C subfamily serine protease
MRFLRTPFMSALLGGGLVAVAFLIADPGGGDRTKTVVQPAAISPPTTSADTPGKGLTVRDIYKRDAPGVVFVRSQIVRKVQTPFDIFPQEQRGEATGSGFVVDKSGDILTNAHVIAGADKVTVSFEDEKTVNAKVVGRDPSTDLAVLKVDPKGLRLRPLELGNSKSVQVGDPTIAIGNPFGLDRTLTTGVVSALQRRIDAPNGFSIDNVIQTDAAINPGNSGGPLLDAAGRVIGINSQIATGAGSKGNVGIGFAVPINTAKEIIPQLEKSGRVERAYLGITGATIDESLSALNLAAKSGVLVQTVVPGGPAAKAGVQGGDTQASVGGNDLALGGDVIQKVDGKPVKSMQDVVAQVANHEPGEKLTLDLLRDGRSKQVRVSLGSRPNHVPSE